jgi:ParB family transcriptional regulator, chromosome partitioning protein
VEVRMTVAALRKRRMKARKEISPSLHFLKIWPAFFAQITSGKKTCELRKNDRGFKVGHMLCLQEFDPKRKIYTGLETQVSVTGIIENFKGLERGYCILSIKLIVGRLTRMNAEKAGKR